MQITKGQVLKYVFLPGIAPRFKSLFTSGFGHIAFFIAHIFASIGLLPPAHPYLATENAGRFGVVHVVVEAYHNLKLNWRQLDRVAIFAVMILGLVLLFAQFCVLGFAIFIQAAEASNLFSTPQPTHDLAFIMLDRVFGVDGLYNSCVSQNVPCHLGAEASDTGDGPFPYPYHNAIHAMLQFYSTGLLVIAALMFAYFIFAVLAETAQTGTPFGKRFNHVWAPLRIVAAVGLLIPIADGLNAGQYIVLHAAKYGSGFATQGWYKFVDSAVGAEQGALLQEAGDNNFEKFVAKPNAPKANSLMEFFTAVATCVHATERKYNVNVPEDKQIKIDAYVENGGLLSSDRKQIGSYEDMLEYSDYGDIKIVFGDFKLTKGKDGSVEKDAKKFVPYCGEVIIKTVSTSGQQDNGTASGDFHIQKSYYALVATVWWDIRYEWFELPYKSRSDGRETEFTFMKIGENFTKRFIDNDGSAEIPVATDLEIIREFYERDIYYTIQEATEIQASSSQWVTDLKRLGWGGAAIWYNKIAALNGSLIASAYNLPQPSKYPMVMEQVKLKRLLSSPDISGAERFRPYSSDGKPIELNNPDDQQIATALYESQRIWQDSYSEQPKSGNVFIDVVNLIFGTQGLFDMRENVERGTHPLAILTSMGKAIVDNSIRNIGYSFGGAIGGGLAGILDLPAAASVAKTFAKFAMMTATMGLSIGFLLYYIIPFLPFLYFFFALGTWVKGLFESMVGVPLWALAHIRIDGNGLPGDAAAGGYFLILEVFLRPIFVVFGLLAGIIVFAAQMQILNEIWDIVVSNVAGPKTTSVEGDLLDNLTDAEFIRGPVDTIFYTIMYAIIAYMMAMSSFKLVDQVPNGILRWMGQSVQTFGDQAGDQAGNFASTIMTQTQSMTNQLKSAGEGLGGAAKAFTSMGRGNQQ
jgi:conjugal transfer/type IV secretion protein DotA/TraY